MPENKKAEDLQEEVLEETVEETVEEPVADDAVVATDADFEG